MKTNRELYENIGRLVATKAQQSAPSLKDYLSALITRAGQVARKESLSSEEFLSLLRDAFDGPGETSHQPESESFKKWKRTIEEQIEDLRQMARNGQLEDEQRYFGLSAPSGRQWYNFDPCGYIECGVAGCFGGWVEGDDTGRDYVPGQVACIHPDGSSEFCDPRDLDQSPVDIPGITWDMLSDFAWCGQHYE